ncbi:hypothetical protein BUALT_Bualt12G0110000 [Buddleja alternifolia]|uniref:Uncharacterized protein n=1 Tax=Buddleja alternifolia TaxID=168488 RepID=A0AAV6WWK8_9LAMI|nr:hypothetical protein BUALT_Bualt12G0110000 [Buddleja alternifolia]
MLIEERSLRQNSKHHLHSKFESLAAMQTGLQTVVFNMQSQLQSIADQMYTYNKNGRRKSPWLLSTLRVKLRCGSNPIWRAKIPYHGLNPFWSYWNVLINKDFPEDYFTTIFISGLREDIKGSVMTLKPTTLLQDLSLAKKQESTIDAIIHRASTLHKHSTPPKLPFNPTQHSFSPLTRAPTLPSKQLFNPQRKFLIASEMRARREENLCYNCDETFVPGHICKQRQVYMIMS